MSSSPAAPPPQKCACCGSAAVSGRCGRCRCVAYCSVACQRLDWLNGGHAERCLAYPWPAEPHEKRSSAFYVFSAFADAALPQTDYAHDADADTLAAALDKLFSLIGATHGFSREAAAQRMRALLLDDKAPEADDAPKKLMWASLSSAQRTALVTCIRQPVMHPPRVQVPKESLFAAMRDDARDSIEASFAALLTRIKSSAQAVQALDDARASASVTYLYGAEHEKAGAAKSAAEASAYYLEMQQLSQEEPDDSYRNALWDYYWRVTHCVEHYIAPTGEFSASVVTLVQSLPGRKPPVKVATFTFYNDAATPTHFNQEAAKSDARTVLNTPLMRQLTQELMSMPYQSTPAATLQRYFFTLFVLDPDMAVVVFGDSGRIVIGPQFGLQPVSNDVVA
jgi:hypothetical protein